MEQLPHRYYSQILSHHLSSWLDWLDDCLKSVSHWKNYRQRSQVLTLVSILFYSNFSCSGACSSMAAILSRGKDINKIII